MRRKSRWLKRVTVAKSAGLQNFLRIPYSLPVTRYSLPATADFVGYSVNWQRGLSIGLG
jgi:hypothetical protein